MQVVGGKDYLVGDGGARETRSSSVGACLNFINNGNY